MAAVVGGLDGRHHLLNGLPGHSQLAGDVCLCVALVEKKLHQVTSLSRQPSGLPGVFEGLRAHFLDLLDHCRMVCCVRHHPSMTTPGCLVNQRLSFGGEVNHDGCVIRGAAGALGGITLVAIDEGAGDALGEGGGAEDEGQRSRSKR